MTKEKGKEETAVAAADKTKLTPYPYQQECIDIINSLPDGSREIFSLATGLGKTLTFSRIDLKGGRMLILSHRDELVRQPIPYFAVPVGVEKASEVSNGEQVVSASIQSLSTKERYKKFPPDYFDVIVVDEAHHAAAPTYKEVITYFKPKKLLGFTATPKRGDNVKLDDIFDKIAYERNLIWGIRNGYLCNLKSRAILVDIDMSKVSFTAGDYNSKQLERAISKSGTYQAVAAAYNENVFEKGKHCLIYCVTLAGCEAVRQLIIEQTPSEKKNIAIVSAQTPDAERQQIIEDFKDPNKKYPKTIINCMVLTEGFNADMVDVLLICRPTANSSLYTQIVGRGTRLYKGKEYCLVLDVMPKSTHKLCSVVELAGVDWSMLTEAEKNVYASTDVDLEELARKVEEALKYQAKLLKFRKEKFDILLGQIGTEAAFLSSKADEGIRSFVDAVATQDTSKKAAALEEDFGEEADKSLFMGLHYTIGPYNENHYIITGEPSNFAFYLSRPDMLGNVSVKAVINIGGKDCYYKTDDNGIKFKEAILTIKRILTNHCPNTQYCWNEATIAAWDKSEASYRQTAYIKHHLEQNGLGGSKIKVETSVSKLSATLAIDRLSKYEQMLKEQKELQVEIERDEAIKRAKEEAENSKGRKRAAAVAQIQKSPQEEQIKIYEYPFSELVKAYSSIKLRDELPMEERLKSGVMIVPAQAFASKNPPSDRQRQYAVNLFRDLGSRADILPADLGAYIKACQNSTQMGRFISTAKAILGSEIFFDASHRPTVDFTTAINPIFFAEPRVMVESVRVKYSYSLPKREDETAEKK